MSEHAQRPMHPVQQTNLFELCQEARRNVPTSHDAVSFSLIDSREAVFVRDLMALHPDIPYRMDWLFPEPTVEYGGPYERIWKVEHEQPV
jgi:hypothetical protein